MFVFVYQGVALLLASAVNLKVFITWMSSSPSCQISSLTKQSVSLSNDTLTASKTNKVILVNIIKQILFVSESGMETVSGMQTAVLAKVAKKARSQAVEVLFLEKCL